MAAAGAAPALRRLLLCALVAALLNAHACWRTDHKPRVFGDRIKRSKLVTTHREVQRKIVNYHNFFRSQVEPPASNMLRMVSAIAIRPLCDDKVPADNTEECESKMREVLCDFCLN
ncbi:uncharacterized protein GBIM_02895 [Gryllus bimaculatus]|nr:uncharacterized protein GBIM_02895 [Gryllus bimaculatus]